MSSAYFVLAAIVVVPIFVWLSWRNPLYLLFGHVLSRVILDSMSASTYVSLGPLSLMQAYTIIWMFVILGYLLAKGRADCFAFRNLIGAIALAATVSSLISFNWASLLVISTKWIYLGLLIALVQYCYRRNSEQKVLITMWVCFGYAAANQFLFFLTRPPSITRGVVSYSGSYGHESDLGFLLLGFLMVSMVLFLGSRGSAKKLIFGVGILYAHVGLYLNNYRTVTAALMIFWSVFIFLQFRKITIEKRLGLMLIVVVVPFIVFAFIGENLSEKFSDVFVFLSDPGRYLDFSGRAPTNNLMSGRIDIINRVMAAYTNAPAPNILFGLGPGSSELFAGVYAHNEYLSALVETGIVGFVVLISVVIYLMNYCYRLSVFRRGATSVYCAVYFTIVFTGIATMPFRDMRSMLVLAFSLGSLEFIRRQNVRKNSRLIMPNGGSDESRKADVSAI